MSTKSTRLVFGAAIWATRIFGCILIAVAILGLPQMRFLTGTLAADFGLLTSVTLIAAGAIWLVGVQMFLRFFDRYLSRN